MVLIFWLQSKNMLWPRFSHSHSWRAQHGLWCTVLPPSLHPKLPTWAPALCWEGSWPGPSLPCSGMQGTEQQLVFQCPPRGVFAAQQSPVTPLRLQGCVLGFSFQPQAPYRAPCARPKRNEQPELSGLLVMIPSALAMSSWFKSLAWGALGAAGLVLTSSCRLMLEAAPPERQNPGSCWGSRARWPGRCLVPEIYPRPGLASCLDIVPCGFCCLCSWGWGWEDSPRRRFPCGLQCVGGSHVRCVTQTARASTLCILTPKKSALGWVCACPVCLHLSVINHHNPSDSLWDTALLYVLHAGQPELGVAPSRDAKHQSLQSIPHVWCLKPGDCSNILSYPSV